METVSAFTQFADEIIIQEGSSADAKEFVMTRTIESVSRCMKLGSWWFRCFWVGCWVSNKDGFKRPAPTLVQLIFVRGRFDAAKSENEDLTILYLAYAWAPNRWPTPFLHRRPTPLLHFSSLNGGLSSFKRRFNSPLRPVSLPNFSTRMSLARTLTAKMSCSLRLPSILTKSSIEIAIL